MKKAENAVHSKNCMGIFVLFNVVLGICHVMKWKANKFEVIFQEFENISIQYICIFQ